MNDYVLLGLIVLNAVMIYLGYHAHREHLDPLSEEQDYEDWRDARCKGLLRIPRKGIVGLGPRH